MNAEIIAKKEEFKQSVGSEEKKENENRQSSGKKKKKSIPEKESPLLNAKIEQKLGTDSS